MIPGIDLVFRTPRKLVAVHCDTVLDRRHFVIAGTQVKADAAAIPMAALGGSRFALRRHIVRLHHRHCKSAFVHTTHQVRIKRPRPTRRVATSNVLTNSLRSAHVYPPPAPRPEEEFDE